jgi:hypothetical protein
MHVSVPQLQLVSADLSIVQGSTDTANSCPQQSNKPITLKRRVVVTR